MGFGGIRGLKRVSLRNENRRNGGGSWRNQVGLKDGSQNSYESGELEDGVGGVIMVARGWELEQSVGMEEGISWAVGVRRGAGGISGAGG